jgi:hypothetical protein
MIAIPKGRSIKSLNDFKSFGLVVSNEKPTDSSEYFLDRLADFKIIKHRILGEIMGIVSHDKLRNTYCYTIRSVPELNECGMMRPAYYQLLFRTREQAAATMAILQKEL